MDPDGVLSLDGSVETGFTLEVNVVQVHLTCGLKHIYFSVFRSYIKILLASWSDSQNIIFTIAIHVKLLYLVQVAVTLVVKTRDAIVQSE